MSVPPKPTRVGKGPSTSGLPNASNPARAYVPPWQMNADPSRMPSPFTSSPTSGAPPVPSRGGSAFANNFSPFSSFSSPMANSFGMSPFSSYSSPFYGPYGRSLGMNSNNGLSPFVHFANENARPAFESVEALVMAVRSVSMMVESTYQAVHSSFWAVLGVADHFSKLKSQIASVVSSLSILRLFKWILDQFLIFLRFKQQTQSSSTASEWCQTFEGATSSASKATEERRKPATYWPLVAFFSIALGAPWMIWKLLSVASTRTADTCASDAWASGAGEHYIAKADFDYRASASDEISFRGGDLLKVAPKHLQPSDVRGWLLASANGEKVGLIPANYVQILVKREVTNDSSDNETGCNNSEI